jgi:hypothetical protein
VATRRGHYHYQPDPPSPPTPARPLAHSRGQSQGVRLDWDDIPAPEAHPSPSPGPSPGRSPQQPLSARSARLVNTTRIVSVYYLLSSTSLSALFDICRLPT